MNGAMYATAVTVAWLFGVSCGVVCVARQNDVVLIHNVNGVNVVIYKDEVGLTQKERNEIDAEEQRAADAMDADINLDYETIFRAIAAATKVEGNAISVSVKAFIAAIAKASESAKC